MTPWFLLQPAMLEAVAVGADALYAIAAAGPPADLPAPVPDFVGGILDAVRSFLDGSVDNLGEAVSGLTPGGGPEQ
ncbi:MAG: hypothetical protein ABEH77_05650 [Halobacteriaceae archaeon]